MNYDGYRRHSFELSIAVAIKYLDFTSSNF